VQDMYTLCMQRKVTDNADVFQITQCSQKSPRKLWVHLLALPLLSDDSGQVVYTHVSLSPSSIIWYQPKGGDAVWLGPAEK